MDKDRIKHGLNQENLNIKDEIEIEEEEIESFGRSLSEKDSFNNRNISHEIQFQSFPIKAEIMDDISVKEDPLHLYDYVKDNDDAKLKNVGNPSVKQFQNLPIKDEIMDDDLVKEDPLNLHEYEKENNDAKHSNVGNTSVKQKMAVYFKMLSPNKFYCKSSLKTHERLTSLEETNNDDELESGDIILHIPDSEVLTDEDSEISDEDVEGDLNHLGCGLLNTKCDFVPQTQTGDEVSQSSIVGKNAKKWIGNKRAKISNETIWNNTVPIFNINSSKPPSASLSDEIAKADDELQLLKLFFTDNIMDHIVTQTNIYAQQKNASLDMTKQELWVVFGGMLFSGYAKYPNKRFYWSTQDDTPSILSNAIRCRRFESILNHIHLNDNSNLDPSDRLYKLRPFLDHLSEKYLEMYELEENLSIDESMIPYFGRHYAKQYIKGKPIRFGFKNWALCSSTGYMYAFDMYMGKSENDTQKLLGLGVGGEVVKKLITKANVQGHAGFKVYCDNYFTSYNLLKCLSDDGICATGTIRENRIINCPLPRKGEFHKMPKGSVEFASTDKVVVIRYKANDVLTIASNFQKADMGTTKRYSKESKGYISYPQLIAVKHYNSFMGGVDQLDQWVACYRTRMRKKKWWWPIFLYFFDVTIVNAWILWEKAKNSKVPLLDFRRNLAVTVLKSYRNPSNQGKKMQLTRGVRFDGMNHWLQRSNLRRCAFCPGKASFSCSKCNVGLHPKCHRDFHIPN